MVIPMNLRSVILSSEYVIEISHLFTLGTSHPGMKNHSLNIVIDTGKPSQVLNNMTLCDFPYRNLLTPHSNSCTEQLLHQPAALCVVIHHPVSRVTYQFLGTV